MTANRKTQKYLPVVAHNHDEMGNDEKIILSLNIKEAYCTSTAENNYTATVPNIDEFLAVNVIICLLNLLSLHCYVESILRCKIRR